MQRFSFKKGLTFVETNIRWQLLRRLITGRLQFESDEGEIKNLTDKEVVDLYNSHKWFVDINTLGINSDAIYLVTPADLSTYPAKWQEIAKRRLHYLNTIDPQNNKYNPDLWKKLIEIAAKEIADNKPPCPSSVQTWWKRYRITKSINNLLPRVQTGYSKKEDPRYTIFEDVIKTVYLNAQKLPIAAVVNNIQQRITLSNMHHEQKIKQISKATIYRWVKNLRSDIKDSSRLGANVALNKYRSVMGILKVSQILERVEIDHTPLDLMVFSKLTMLPLGRAWITLALDKYSRMVVGFYISFNSPSSYAVMQCLKQMILPKDNLLKLYPDIKNEWPVFGIPDLLALDNGMDLHSEASKKACLELGIQILYCPAATPQMKGSVERFFRTINQGLIHRLPGTTFSDISERGDYPAEGLAAIDLETLVHLVLKWIVDVYNVTPHRGIGDTPYNKWIDSFKHRIIDLPVYPKQLDVITGIPARRTVFHYGIELEGLHYNSRQLQEVRKISGENMQVELKFYEELTEYIDVFEPYSKEYLRVEAINGDYVKDLHRAAHRMARVQARKKFGELYSMPQLMEARIEIEEIIKDAVKSKKMGDRKLAANLMMHDSNSIFEYRSKNEEAKKPFQKNAQKAPEPLDSGLDDQLPDLGIEPSKANDFRQGGLS
jgi:putative transposase